MKAKLTLLLVLVVATVAILSGCGNNNSGNTGGNTAGENAGEASNSGGAEQVFRMNLGAEPPTLDPALMQDQVSSTVMSGLFEGLTRMENGEAVNAMAEDIQVSEDGLKYTFKIRPDAKWSNGDAVTAHDFEYSWKRTLDPNLNPPAPYAYQLYYIKNAEEYNTGKGATVDQVGVKAIDDATLEVELKNPTPYFKSLLSFYTYYPVNKAVVSANPAWAAEAETYVSNGPFKLASWAHSDSIDLVPFENYYGKGDIKLSKVHFVMISDASTESNMYETDELDWSGKPTGQIPTEQLAMLIQDKNPELVSQPQASTYYYNFNNTKKPFSNVKVRKALAMAIDRKAIVEKVTKGNEIPAYGFVPPGIHGVNGDFRDEVTTEYFKEDVTEAKKLLAEGLAEEGMTAIPEFELSYNESDTHKAVAEAIADMWKTNLGITVKTQTVEWKVFLQNRTSLAYDVARAGWGADYNDPMTYIDMWITKGGNNDTGFSNAEYDKLVKEAYATSDQQARVDAMAKAEKILIGDNMAIMPIFYSSVNTLVKPYVKNVTIDYKGDIDYTRAYIEK
ncbi:peptide ABC transporter substrate-binding protein [Paenibacillus xanthanilyticus]|uniref:Peptide ABC transporter substrate-binding protein n=1 Tax=Paenibacillus xanthanilyticus TaxID=1783531 RepID=A0ABV8K3B5_9BACL